MVARVKEPARKKYVPATLTDEESRRIDDLVAMLEERKTKKVHLELYDPLVLQNVRTSLVSGVPLQTICKRYSVPAALVLNLQTRYNPHLRKLNQFNTVDKLFYGWMMINDGYTDQLTCPQY